MFEPKSISLMLFSRGLNALSRITWALLRSVGWLKVAILVSGGAAALMAGNGVVAAQGGPADAEFVDLAVEVIVPDDIPSRFNHYFLVTVANKGTFDAYDVEVRITIDIANVSGNLEVTASRENSPTPIPGLPEGTFANDSDNTSTGVWRLDRLPAQQAYTASFTHVFNLSGSVRSYDAEIRAAEGFESEARLGNNTSRAHQAYGPFTVRTPTGRRGVTASVDNRFPATDGTGMVNLTVTATRPRDNAYYYSKNVTVSVDLPTGLTPGTATFDPSDRNMTYDPVTSEFAVGTMGRDLHTEYKMTLPLTVSNGAVLEEQCLTAEINGVPEEVLRLLWVAPGVAFDDVSDNVARLCLGASPVSVYTHGDIDIWTMYPCVGNTNEPCDSTDDVRVRSVDHAVSPARILDSGTVVVHVRDKPGRVFDDHTGSVTDAATVSWQTSTLFEGRQYLGTIQGPRIRWSQQPFVDVRDQWTEWNRTFTATGLGGGEPLGNVSERWVGTGIGKAIMTSENSWTASYSDPVTSRERPFLTMLEFEKLGTYVLDHTLEATHATNVDAQDQAIVYSGTNRTIIHVGPLSELEVRDYGASPDAGSNEVAFTVMALNHGLDSSVASKVDIALPDGATLVRAVPSSGAYEPEFGVWTVGPLMSREFRLVRSLPEGETLTLVVTGVTAGDLMAQATATIYNDNTNSPYQVCISSTGATVDAANESACTTASGSWHEGTVYDPNDNNNAVTLTARAGTGAHLSALRIVEHVVAAVVVEWEAVNALHNWPVIRYEIKASDPPCQMPDAGETGTAVFANKYIDIDVEPGDARCYHVRAVNAQLVKGPWADLSPGTVKIPLSATAGAPAKPVLTAAPSEPNRREEILVRWDKPVENGSPIVSYTLEASDTERDGSWSDTGATLGANATSWVHTGLTGGTRKHYRLRATNMCDNDDPTKECHSPWSDPVNATTDPPGQSGPPTNVRAVPDGDTAIDVSWHAPLDDGGTPITRYEVQWSADGSTNWRNAGNTADGETLIFKNTGMTFGTTRYYRVAARNSRGLSLWSAPPYASAMTLAGVPGQPNLAAQATNANTIELTWTEPADNGSAIIRYELDWSPNGTPDSWIRLSDPSVSDNSYTNGGLDPGTERYYRIRAVNGATPGEGSWSTVRSAKTPPAVPAAPDLRAAANGENAIELSWDPPTDNGGAAISGYELQVSSDGGANYSLLASPSALARSYTHSGLKPGDERLYQLRARNSAGWGPVSQSVYAFTVTGVPAAPGLTVRASGSTEIKLTWTKPDGNGSEINRYELDVSNDGNDWSTLSDSISDNDSEYVHSGLSSGTTKYYRIRAWNGNGAGQWSITRSAQTDSGGPEAPVLTAMPVSERQIDLSWTEPADNGSSITGYWVERSVSSDGPWERLTSNRSMTYSDTDLYRGTKRYYRVAATNRVGTGPYSNLESATSIGAPATAPESPTLLRLSNVDRNQVTIAWDAPDNDGGAPVSGYEYEVAPPCQDQPAVNCGFTGNDIKTATGSSARISGLSTGGAYYFRVRAVNPIGTGGWSQETRADLRPSMDGQVSVSPTTITMDEGDTAAYVVRLTTEPPHPVVVRVILRGSEDSNDIQDEVHEYLGHILVPDGWTHPQKQDWSTFTHNWRRGVRVSFTAIEDDDDLNDVVVADHSVTPVPYDDYRPCQGHSNPEKCQQDWDEAWEKSPYLQLTGASVIVTVRDND